MEKTLFIRNTLSKNKIKYNYKVVNSNGSSIFGLGRGHMGSFEKKLEYKYHYYIYVYKKDYDKAIWLLNNNN